MLGEQNKDHGSQKRTTAAGVLVDLLEANVDDENISDEDFRAFVRNSVSTVKRLTEKEASKYDSAENTETR